MTSSPRPRASVLPGRAPAALRVRTLQDERFLATMESVRERLRTALRDDGYQLGEWVTLPAAQSSMGWAARLLDPMREQPLEFKVWANVSPHWRVSVIARVLDPAQPDGGVLVCLAETSNLGDAAQFPDAQQRVADELEYRTAFIEPAPGGGTLRAIRVSKQFFRPDSWVGDAAKVLLSALDPC